MREGLRFVEIPASIQAIKTADMSLALQWRMETRQVLEDAFQCGMTAVDVVRDTDVCYYLLRSGAAEQTHI